MVKGSTYALVKDIECDDAANLSQHGQNNEHQEEPDNDMELRSCLRILFVLVFIELT